MADRDWRFDRHYELWKESNKQVARWAFGAVVFATVVLWKVLTPYTDFSGQMTVLQQNQVRAQQELAAIERDVAALGRVSAHLQAVQATVTQAPWMVERTRLVDALADLAQASRTLAGAAPAQVLQALREPSPPVGPLPMAQQVAPRPDLQRVPLGQQSAVLPPSNPLARAAGVLGIEPERLEGLTDAGFRQLLDQQRDRRVQQEADDKVRRIVQRVREAVLEPLERLLQEDREAAGALTGLPAMLGRTRADMDEWARAHIGNRFWYETIQQKDRELNELTNFLRQRQETLVRVVRDQQSKLEPQKTALQERKRAEEERLARLQKELGNLDVKMQKLLPEWLRELVSPAEMLALYPVALLGLAAIIALKAGLVRRHYVVVRESVRPRNLVVRDAAASSVWTLVYRGPRASMITAALYLGGAVLLWWLFEKSFGLLDHGAPPPAGPPWSALGPALPGVRWVGRAAFVVLVASVPVILLRDRKAAAPEPAPGSAPSGA